MGVVIPRMVQSLSQADDFRQEVFQKMGDLSGYEVFHNMVLVAVYIRPEKTKGGILRPEGNVEEDIWQSKIGTVLKVGPNAFKDDDTTKFHGQKVEPRDWCMFRVGDTLLFYLHDIPCRLVEDSLIKMKIDDPSFIL